MAQDPIYMEIEQTRGCLVATILLEELLYSIEVEAVHHQLEKLVESNPGATLILNLARVKAVSSELIGSVLMLQRQARTHQGTLRLCDLDERVLHVFKLSRVDANLDIQPDLEAALSAAT